MTTEGRGFSDGGLTTGGARVESYGTSLRGTEPGLGLGLEQVLGMGLRLGGEIGL